MDLQAFRAALHAGFVAEGLHEARLKKGAPKVWTLPSSEVIRYFAPDAQRRSWGFNFFGTVGIEIPAFRDWLNTHKPGEQAGIFQSGFVAYYTLNEDPFRDFRIVQGQPVPHDLWVGLIKDRLEQIPPTLDLLIATYRTNREVLGRLAHPLDNAAWDFLMQWRDKPDPTLSVPYRLPNGRMAFP